MVVIKDFAMKKYIYKIFTIFVLIAAAVSCKSDEMRSKEDLVGDWHYAGTENGVAMDIWLSLNLDDTFEMYQMVGEGAYWKSTGKYTADIETGIISGRYSDKTPWAHDYEFSVNGSVLTLTAVDTPSYTTTYKRETVPAEVKEKSLDLTKSSEMEFVPYL